MYIKQYQKLLTTIIRGTMIVSKQMNIRNNTERKGIDYVCVWILPNKYKAADTIIFDSASRMSRNADEDFCLYEELYNKGIELVFLKEPHINTSTYEKALESNISMTGTNTRERKRELKQQD